MGNDADQASTITPRPPAAHDRLTLLPVTRVSPPTCLPVSFSDNNPASTPGPAPPVIS